MCLVMKGAFLGQKAGSWWFARAIKLHPCRGVHFVIVDMSMLICRGDYCSLTRFS